MNVTDLGFPCTRRCQGRGERPELLLSKEDGNVVEPVLIGAGAIVLVSAVGSTVRAARQWAVSEVTRIVARVLNEQYRPAGPHCVLPRPAPRTGSLNGTEEFRHGGDTER